MAIKEVKLDDIEVETVVDEQSSIDDFGFEAEYVEGYKTISGNEQRDISNATGYYLSDLEIGNIVTGYPEVTIFENNEKDDNGDYVKNYQSPRIRIIDGDEEYVDLYANIPRKDNKGFIRNLNRNYDFFRGGFDLVFSFMRWVNEANVYDDDGETINRINMVNIENICKKIDTMEYIKIKVVKGANEDFPSFIILDMKQNI